MNKDLFVKAIEASAKRRPCDLVIKNVNVVDVFQCSTFISDVGISNGYIVGLGEYSGTTEIDGTGKYICPSLIDSHAHIESSLLTPKEYYKCALRHGITSMVVDPHEIDGTGKYICPSLIDSHAHIESSLLTPKEYYKCALRHGITSMVVDPHEIANVFGKKGIDFMIDSSKDIPFDFYFMLSSCVPATSFESSGAKKGIDFMIDSSKDIPFDFYFMLSSCVPATSFESSGAILNSSDLKPYYANKNVLGLAEVMNYPAVVNCEEDMIQKLWDDSKTLGC